MRAAARPHSPDPSVTHVAAGTARQAFVRLMIAIMATIALLFVWRPTVVHAQDSTARKAPATAAATAQATTHLVRAGESLWSLAVRYYGDGAAWQELARANAVVSTASRPLVVGMRLTVPPKPPARATGATAPLLKAGADVPKPALAVALAPRPAAAAPASRASLSAQTAGKGDAAQVAPRSARSSRATRTPSRAPARVATAKPSVAPAGSVAAQADSASRAPMLAPGARTVLSPQMKAETPLVRTVRIGLVEPGGTAAARGSEPSTIFIRRVPTLEEAQAQARAATRTHTIAPRRGEFDAAPFAITPARLATAGRIVRRVGAAAAGSTKDVQRVLIADEVEITPPSGVSLSVGDRLVALQERGVLENGTRVALPGGVLVVTQADAGKPVIAIVHRQSGQLQQGNLLLPATGGPAAPARADAASGDQMRTTVIWVDNDALLPTLQSYLLLAAGTAQGVQAGDEFALVKTRGSANTGEEQRVAVVRVVRSDATGSTAIVVRQDRGEIATGISARRVARMQ